MEARSAGASGTRRARHAAHAGVCASMSDCLGTARRSIGDAFARGAAVRMSRIQAFFAAASASRPNARAASSEVTRGHDAGTRPASSCG